MLLRLRTITWLAAVIGVVLLNVGCAPPRVHTTFLRSVDLIEMTDRMAASFASDDVLGNRSPDAEPWIISIRRIENHTNQIIPEREKWLYVARLRAQLAEARLSDQHSLTWVMPPDRWAQVAKKLGESEPASLRMSPTHLLTAEFHTLTSTSGTGRSDTYVCNYQLLNLQSGRLLWEDQWEVKRAVTGRTYD